MNYDSGNVCESIISMEEYLEKRQQIRKNLYKENGREFWTAAAESAVMELEMLYV